MASDREERDETEEADVGLVGGGGPAETMDEDTDDEALDEHGDRLRAPEEDES